MKKKSEISEKKVLLIIGCILSLDKAILYWYSIFHVCIACNGSCIFFFTVFMGDINLNFSQC